MKTEELTLFDLDTIPTNKTRQSLRQKWIRKFTKHCDEIYLKEGDLTGHYCCGYHWCCDKCYGKFMRGCRDCVATIEDILTKHYGAIDYEDYDFEKWEKLAYDLYIKCR